MKKNKNKSVKKKTLSKEEKVDLSQLKDLDFAPNWNDKTNKSVKKKTLSKKEKEDLKYKKLERILEKVAKIPITKESKKKWESGKLKKLKDYIPRKTYNTPIKGTEVSSFWNRF